MFKKTLSILLAVMLVVMPMSSTIVFNVAAADGTLPLINISVKPYAVIHPNTTVTVTFTAQGGSTLASCDTRLEGVSIGTGSTVSFTPASRGLSDGLYTLVAQATDSDGDVAYAPLTFTVDADADLTYTIENGTVQSGSSVTMYEADALDFAAQYGTSADGTVDMSTLKNYSSANLTDLRYTDDALTVASASGIPYQMFTVDLAGKTSGKVAVSYNGSTKAGERVAVKVLNAKTNKWDVIGTIIGAGNISELVDVATYNVGGKLYAAAVLDYVSNGSDTMIWSTDPQHYTKFNELNAFYYEVYQYAADQYKAGNAGYIITTGDLVDDRPSASVAPAQWQVADKAMSIVEKAGMPNGLVSGNHDVGDYNELDYSAGPNTSSDYSMYEKTFPADRYNNTAWYGGSINNNTSHYDLVTIGNVDFIVFYLGYGLEATEETIAWANAALKTYRHRTAIITTHNYLDANSAVHAQDSRADLIFNKIVDPNPNVKMVLCGHDDGSLMLEKTTSDGRTVYEILSDYQFVEAEDDSFYASEHHIGSVANCCGDGYIRLMTVSGDSLSSITYSPVTDRYNPHGDREEFTIDLNLDTADRRFSTYAFSAAVLGNATTATNVDRVGVVTDGANTTYTPVLYTNMTTGDAPATPSAPYYAHAAASAPAVYDKTNLLSKIGLSEGAIITEWTTFGNSASAPLNLQVDLDKTPYLYYSVDQSAGSSFCFALINNNSNVPWLVFRDVNMNGALLNSGNDNWDSYKHCEQYTFTSETGCIDMRTFLKNNKSSIWEIEQINFYNSSGKDAKINYFFFGSAAVPSGNTPVDTDALKSLITTAKAIDTAPYTSTTVSELTAAISAAESASPYYASTTMAYSRLANAIGGLRKVKTTIDESKLTSVKKYTLNFSSDSLAFTAGSNLKYTDTSAGFVMQIPSGVDYAAASNWTSYTVKPERGQVFVKLDVVATSAWAIKLGVKQNGVEVGLTLNNSIENAFASKNHDGYDGTFKGVYDISNSFIENGLDPASTFTVTYLQLYVVSKYGGQVTFNHVQLLTNASDGVTDKTALNDAIARAGTYTQSLYTSSSWSTVSSALSAAKTALSSSSLSESDLNLKAFVLNNALDNLVYNGKYPEKAGSLLANDVARWVPSKASHVNVNRNGNVLTFQNTNSEWPSITHTLDKPMRVFVNESQLVLDMDIGNRSSILLEIGDEEWVKINTSVGAVNNDDDLVAGTINITLPLSEIPELKGMTTVTIYRVRIFSVGDASTSTLTLRSFYIEDMKTDNWGKIFTNYGVAATPSNPYYQHCAPYAPDTKYKVDLIGVLGLEEHPTIPSYIAYSGLNQRIDLNKTPYLYYSIAVPEGSELTFGLFNTSDDTSPYFVYRDGTKSGAVMTSGVANFEAAGHACRLTASETGCIDMRTLMKDTSSSLWKIKTLSFYASGEATVSYMFFGSEPLYVEQNVEIEEEFLTGDVNDDGQLSTQDARAIVKELLRAEDEREFTVFQNKVADFDGDGKVSTRDVRAMLKALAS